MIDFSLIFKFLLKLQRFVYLSYVCVCVLLYVCACVLSYV